MLGIYSCNLLINKGLGRQRSNTRFKQKSRPFGRLHNVYPLEDSEIKSKIHSASAISH